jgi:hypothetical protein
MFQAVRPIDGLPAHLSGVNNAGLVEAGALRSMGSGQSFLSGVNNAGLVEA